MIIWIASYPKSGNTWIRSLLSSYFYSKDGIFDFNLLKKIEQFSSKNLSSHLENQIDHQTKISKNWIAAQRLVNKDKKIHFLKTHNAICSINGNKFTDKFNTISAIYIVRDPRNLITSLANHYEINLKDAFHFMTNKRKIIFLESKKVTNQKENSNEDFNFLGDWGTHYKSWKNINFCKIKIIKYEDILSNPHEIFISILNFLSQFVNINMDQKKISNSIESTSFNNLSKMEDINGFEESVISSKTKKKIKIFNLGKKNNWKNLIDESLVRKINSHFKTEMTELGYL